MSNEINNSAQPTQYLLIPITAAPGLHQMFSFQQEMSFEYSNQHTI